MKILYFIAIILSLIFIALAWRYLLVIFCIFIVPLMLYLLFHFVKGVIDGFKGLAKAE
jgi:hypothetical protein